MVWLLLAVGVLLIGVLAYWQLVIAEGSYLGQGVVTCLYDLTAERYDAIKGFDPEMESVFLARPLITALASDPEPMVLDVGTGTARLPLALLGQPSFGGSIIGVDASHGMLRIAASKTREYADRLSLIWRDARKLTFPDATFDAVTCLEMIEFTPKPEGQLAEAVRVLRPGGLLLTTRRRGLDAKLMPGRTHSREAFTELLEQLGLIHVEIKPWQVDYDLVWGFREGWAQRYKRSLLEILCCPCCAAIAFEEILVSVSNCSTELECKHCGAVYPVRQGVIELDS